MKRLILLAGLAAGGCSMVPHLDRPKPPVPESWPVGDAYLKANEATLPHVDYRDIFRDPRLQQVIAAALANNRDLRVAAANIEAARAQFHIDRAAELPRISETASVTESDAGTGRTNANGSKVTGGARTNYALNTNLSAFEIDLFGRVRALAEASQDRYFATEAGARATRLSLVASVATAWLNYAADETLLAISRDTAANAERRLKLVKARLDGGIAPRSDYTAAETILATAQADVANQTTLAAQDMNALQLLVGAPVDAALLPASIDDADKSIAELPAGLSSDILLRRPDVVQAEYQMRAANAQLGAAKAALFPTISLTAAGGLASNALTRLFTGGAFNYSVTPQVSYNLFSGGAGRAGVREASANRDAAVATYEKAIQSAFRDVADALARRGTIDDQLAANLNLAEAARDSFRLTDARYKGGIDPILTSLDAQRTLYTAERTLIATRLAKASNLVTLYRVLGGDAQLDANPKGPADR
ncbi:efflux transporter outer membrane subunit [Sphingomonas sp. GlSt437]|uniref:efflux transporter outer membrane subunit n=1 Tax=Sphingomonas sp. GlSt437 TaxID=3389970 RepID=UPI003A8728C9